MPKTISTETYLRGAGLALKAGDKAEAAEFFFKGGEYETAALLFEQLGRHTRQAAAHEAANQPLDAAKAASDANAEKTMISYLQKIAPGERDYREAVLVLARALTRRGWSALAIETLERALGKEPIRAENLELWYSLARAHEEHGELSDASEILDRILAFQYDFREAESWRRRLDAEHNARVAEREQDTSFHDRYERGELLGKGGMGAVYRATDRLLDREVAYKILPDDVAREPGALEQLLNEARAAAALNHPNIVTIHDVGLLDGDGYIAMELVDGESYARILKRRGRLELNDVMHCLVSVCQGLDHAHRRGVIHRDIKPSNILLTDEDRVKIVDFGIAQSAKASDGDRVGGTLNYIAPEQARGLPTDARTDIYALGATLYELIAGSPPFTEGNIVKHHLETRPEPLKSQRSDIPLPLDTLVLTCLAKNPSARFQTTREIIAIVQSENLFELSVESARR